MAMLGKEIRMSRLVNPVSNKMMAITVDHATSRGIAPMTGIQDVQSAIDKIILGKPDAMTMTKGIAERCMYQHAGKVSILMKISNYSPVAPTKDTIFGTVDEAIRMGADAVSMGCMTLGDFQGEQFEAIGRVAEECMRKGMPLIGQQENGMGKYRILRQKRLRAGHGYCKDNLHGRSGQHGKSHCLCTVELQSRYSGRRFMQDTGRLSGNDERSDGLRRRRRDNGTFRMGLQGCDGACNCAEIHDSSRLRRKRGERIAGPA